jgi:hypothetical protein
MQIEEIKELVKELIEEENISKFEINKEIFKNELGREEFNKTIRIKVEKKLGVYIWVNSENNNIVYIGMAGKLKNNGKFVNHSIQERLLATRGKDKLTKKDIQTNDYVRSKMEKHNIKKIDFHIMYSIIDEPPAYIEALLLYKYYKKNKCLPLLNTSF